MVTNGRGEREGELREMGLRGTIKRYKLLCIKEIRNKDTWGSTGNYSQSLGTDHDGRYHKEDIYTYRYRYI